MSEPALCLVFSHGVLMMTLVEKSGGDRDMVMRLMLSAWISWLAYLSLVINNGNISKAGSHGTVTYALIKATSMFVIVVNNST